jgi:hypothetical protein
MIVGDLAAQENDAVFEQARVDVVRTFTTPGLLNDKWYEDAHDL